jgi:hypothetical protein
MKVRFLMVGVKCERTGFEKTSSDLSDHAVMAKQDLFYRVKTARQSETSDGVKIEAAVAPKTETGS